MKKLNGEAIVLIGSTSGIRATILDEIKDEKVSVAPAGRVGKSRGPQRPRKKSKNCPWTSFRP